MSKIFIIIALFILCLPLTAQENLNQTQSWIEVNGTAEREVMPDRLHIQIEASDTKQIKLDEVESYILKMLKKNNIPADRLSLVDASGQTVEYWFKKDEMVKTKFYKLVIDNTRQLKIVMDELNKKGINRIDLTKTELSNDNELKDELLAEAVKNAMTRATKMLSVTGQKPGKLLVVRENNIFNDSGEFYPPRTYMMKADMQTEQQPQDVAAIKKIKYSASVYVKQAID
jgi:uncharacterized protein